MEIKALVLTLPNPERFYLLKSQRAINPNPIVWEKQYRESLFSMQKMVYDIARGASDLELNEEQKEALINPDLTPRQAEESVQCIWVDADPNRRTPLFLDEVVDNVTKGGTAGYNVPTGMVRYALINNGVDAVLTRDAVKELERVKRGNWTCVNEQGKELPLSRYEPGFKVIDQTGELIDFNSLEMRKDPTFIYQLSRLKDKALEGGRTLRIVTVPYEPRLSIVTSKGKEVLREKPRQWS